MERDAFLCLAGKYKDTIFRVALNMLASPHEAEDAVQETFLKVYRRMGTFRGESSEKTWIMRIAVNTCRDMNRSGWFRFVDRRVTPETLPEQAVQTDESDRDLVAAVTKLPRRLREVILLYYYQSMNVNEIADALGISQSAVSARLKRGREKLKKLLEGRELDE